MALRQRAEPTEYLFGSVLGDRSTALAAVKLTDLGEKKLQVIVDLGHGAHSGTGVLDRVGLINGYCGRDAQNLIHSGLIHSVQKLPGIGGKALHITTLPLGIQCIESQAGLARAAHSSDHRNLVQGKIEIQPLQVILTSFSDLNDFFAHTPDSLAFLEKTPFKTFLSLPVRDV